MFTVSFQDGKCSCAPITVNLAFLSIAYANVYIWFVSLCVVNSILLLTWGILILKWTADTPLSQQFDELNAVTFNEGEKVKITGKGRRTASMCVLPMTISHIFTFSYDATYEFLSAVGTTIYAINSPQQKIGVLLLLINANIIPLILIGYLPPLKELILRCISAPFRCLQKKL